MRLKVKNLGVIREIEVDLSKKFILFCGPNGTGKTYASYILYAFLAYDSIVISPNFDTIDAEIKKTGEFSITYERLAEWLTRLCEAIKGDLESIFGISSDTREKLFNQFDLSVEYGYEEFQRVIDTKFSDAVSFTSNGAGRFTVSKPAGSPVFKITKDSDANPGVEPSSLHWQFYLSSLFRRLAFAGSRSARMLTVERNSIYTFKTELSISRNELIDRIQQSGSKSEFDVFDLVNKSSRRYPLAIRDSLRIANDLENVQKSRSSYASIADEIERDLLHGDVSMTKNGDVEFRSASMSKSRRLPFHLSSSIVKTMASFVIYLRHLAKEGDTLIVDEPEMNFHPDVQVLLARIFIQLSNNGLRVVISTHSDYIIREINLMMMADFLSCNGHSESADSLGYVEGRRLSKDAAEILFFHFRNEKSKFVVVDKLHPDEAGFEVETIDKTIEEQNNRSGELYDIIADLKEGAR